MSRVQELLDLAKRDFTRQGYLQPVVLVQAGGRLRAYPMIQQNEQQRDAFFEMIYSKARELGADSVSVITEAWIWEEGEEPDTARPADAIYVIDVSPLGTIDIAAARILRTAHGPAFESMEPDPGLRSRLNWFSPWKTAQ